jgi:hypothetical protein
VKVRACPLTAPGWAAATPEHNLDQWASEDFKEFAQWCTRVMLRNVAVSIEQHRPGNLSPDEWSATLEVLRAVKAALPDAGTRTPGKS